MYKIQQHTNLKTIQPISIRNSSFINIDRIYNEAIRLSIESLNELLTEEDLSQYHTKTYHYSDEFKVSIRNHVLKEYLNAKEEHQLNKLKERFKALKNSKVVRFDGDIDDVLFESNSIKATIHQFHSHLIHLPKTTKAISDFDIRKISNSMYAIESDILFNATEFNNFAILYKTEKGCSLIDEVNQIIYQFEYQSIKDLTNYLENYILDVMSSKDNDAFVISNTSLSLASRFIDLINDKVTFKSTIHNDDELDTIREKLNKLFIRTNEHTNFKTYQIKLS